MSQIAATFYKFVKLADFASKKLTLEKICQENGIKGTIILAPEGINGTIAGSRPAVATLLDCLKADPRLADLEHRESPAESTPFLRLKVRCKREIVTLGMAEVNPRERSGIPVPPREWQELIQDPQVLLLDTRNAYEVAIGSFCGALDPHIHSFREFPDYVRQHLKPARQQKIAMFCTGGIRCEKASSLLLSWGFEQVYQLKGGILNYLTEIPPEESYWQGECFVFDDRIALQKGLGLGTHEMCRSCGHPIAPADRDSPQYEAGISCPYCFPSLTPEKRRRQQARQRQWQQQQNQERGGKA